MKLLFLSLFCLVLINCDGACEHDNISMCGYSCKNSGSQMVSYSKDKGCQCGMIPAIDSGIN